MATASSLLGLVNQLQQLEHSLTSILMEMAVRMGSLTDTNVFLLVETQEGRKFVGKRHLCDAYMGGTLVPVGNEIEYDVDGSVSALQPKTFFDQSRVHEDAFPNLNGAGEAAPFRKRSEIGDSLFPSPSKRLKFNAAPLVKIENGVDGGLGFREAHQETPPTEEDDDDIEEMVDRGSGFETRRRRQPPAPRRSSSLRQDPMALSLIDPLPLTSDAEDVVSVLNSKISPQKLEALKSICGENACTRGTIENRLSTSACYEFGKTLADIKPAELEDAHARTFFNVNFEKWVSQFANLAGFFQTSIPNGRPEGGQTFTFLGLLRQCARTSFFQRINRNKNRSLSLM